jgi:hypothetical protein
MLNYMILQAILQRGTEELPFRDPDFDPPRRAGTIFLIFFGTSFPGSMILDSPGKAGSVQEQPVICGGIFGGIDGKPKSKIQKLQVFSA